MAHSHLIDGRWQFIPLSKMMPTALFRNASEHSHLRLRLRHQLGFAIMPTTVVLVMVGCLQLLSEQCLIFASLASSAFLVYVDTEHPTNRVRTFLVAQGIAALLGFGSVSLLGTGFLATGVATVIIIVLIVGLDAMHPPAISTALSFASHTNSLKTLAIFGLAMLVMASLVALQKSAFGQAPKVRTGHMGDRLTRDMGDTKRGGYAWKTMSPPETKRAICALGRERKLQAANNAAARTGATMQLTILSASYGSPIKKRFTDTTKNLRKVFESGTPTIKLNTDEGAAGVDPAPFTPKETTITYTINGQRKQKTFPEGYKLTFKDDLQ